MKTRTLGKMQRKVLCVLGKHGEKTKRGKADCLGYEYVSYVSGAVNRLYMMGLISKHSSYINKNGIETVVWSLSALGNDKFILEEKEALCARAMVSK